MSDYNIIIPLTEQFDRKYRDKVNVEEIPDIDKRYIMLVNKKQNLNLPLTEQEMKLS